MNPIRFSFTLHNHQPLGNFDWVIEDSYKKAYLPFIQAVERYPWARVGIHNTGILLEWFQKYHPDYLERLQSLIDKGQVEILTGTYYEAILPSIPELDRIGQIKKLTALIEDLFHCRPGGMWVAERVWEPGLALSLSKAGIDYVFLDDTHFKKAGIPDCDLDTYFITEEQGASIRVVPINLPTRHAIPFDQPERAIEILKEQAERNGGKWIAFADDGEKLGSWPGTYEWVYEEHWIDRFFEEIQKNSWIEMVLPSEAIRSTKSGGIAYLPTASYSEMMEWSGGFWRNFLRRYPESNWMHKRMLQLSLELPAEGPARDEIWKSQCNCPYWHGVFGGLYLSHLRHETYTHILRAETLSKDFSCETNVCLKDIDLDNQDEVILRSPDHAFYFKPSEGASLVEWDYFPKSLNLINTLSRHAESYHAKLLEKIEDAGSYSPDWYLRRSFLDHFLQDGTTPDRFACCSYGEQGDFIKGDYQVDLDPLRFSREGGLWIGNRFCHVKLDKQFKLTNNGLNAIYVLENLEPWAIEFWFGIELNFSFSSGSGKMQFYRIPASGSPVSSLDQTGCYYDQNSIKAVDGLRDIAIELESDQTASIWHFPIKTLSQSERGADWIYQGSGLLFNWVVRLEPGCSWGVTLQKRLLSL